MSLEKYEEMYGIHWSFGEMCILWLQVCDYTNFLESQQNHQECVGFS